jgi:hypothetical protein
MVRGAPALDEAGRRAMTRFHPIAAARPSLMKTAPARAALRRDSRFTVRIVHTGQLGGSTMSEAFLRDPELPATHPGRATGSTGSAGKMADAGVACRRAVAAERRALALARGKPAPDTAVRQPA